MTTPINLFEENVKVNLAGLLTTAASGAGLECTIKLAEETDKKTRPVIIVTSAQAEEAIFRSGIYQLGVEVTVEVDIDNQPDDQAPDPKHTPRDLPGTIMGVTMDVLQQSDLKAQMVAAGGLFLHGVVLTGQPKLNELGDRIWSKTASMDFFGYATTGI
jgi:hypothetical protein